MPRFGLAKAFEHIPVTKEISAARHRLRRERVGEAEPAYEHAVNAAIGD